MSEKQPRLDSLFEAAVQIESAEELIAFLDKSCGDDLELRKQLEMLLLSDEQAVSFLDSPLSDVEGTILTDGMEDSLADSLEAGLSRAFREDAAVVIGNAGHSVLKSLDQSVVVPRIVLRESKVEPEDPLVQPKSAEMPDRNSDSRYQLQGEIARGGMGAIIKGRDTDLGRDLAIKVLLDAHKDKPEVIQRFVEEAQIGGQLQHPGIAPIYELGQFADRRPYFAMKLVKGETLSKLLKERDNPTEDRSKFTGIFEQICQTMAYAHSRGVIHRDLKPANIMVGAFGEVQVMDWGLAKVLNSGGIEDEKQAHSKHKGVSIIQTMRSVGSDTPGTVGSVGSQTQMGSVMGTPAYMPPEQALGEIDQLDERADVFGLGAILCEILTGSPPYVVDDGTQVYRLASRGKLADCFQRLETCGADEDLIALTKDCLQLEPVDRPRDAGVLAERVTGYLEAVEVKLRDAEVERASEAARADAEAAQAAAERQRAEAESARANEESKRRRTSLALAASVLLLVGLGSGGWLYMLRQEAIRQTDEADAQRSHAAEMQTLADQRDEERKSAELARNVAETAQKQADAEKINSLNMLADMQTERGLQAAREGESATAALWFANAAALTPHDLDRQRANHFRASSWLNETIVPAALLSLTDGSVRRFAFQPDGSLLLTVSGTKLRVWDWRNEVALPWSETMEDVTDAAWSPDGRQVAVGFEKADVRICDPFSGNVLKQFRHPEPVSVVEWSPDGTRLAVGGQRVQIWNVADQPARESNWPHPQEVFGMRFNLAGTRMVTSCQDDLARVFAVDDATLPAPLYSPVDHMARFRRIYQSAVFCDEDRKLVTLAGSPCHPVLSDAATGQPVTPGWTKLDESADRCITVSSDSRWVAAAGFRGVFLLGTDGQIVELKHPNHVHCVAFSPDGQSFLTTCWDGTARWWPLHNMEGTSPTVGSLITFPQRGTGALGTFSPDGSSLAISSNQQVVIWDRPQSQWVVGQVAWTDHFWRPRPSFDGQFVTPGTWHGANFKLHPRGGTLQVARMADGQPAGAPIKLNGLLWDSCLCADNRSVAAATVDGATGILTVYDIASGKSVFPSIALPDLPIDVVARPEHHQVAALCRNGDLLVIDTQQGQTLLDVSHHVNSNAQYRFQLAYSPDGSTLLIVTSDEVIVRDAQSGELRFPPLQPGSESGGHSCRAIRFSPDSRLLATAAAGSNLAQVWDLTTGRKVGRDMPHPGDEFGLYSVAFSPDGQRILTAHKDGNARLWDWQSGQLIRAPMPHLSEVYDARFTLDGRHVVTVGRHFSPRVWDVATGKLAVPLPEIVPEGRSSEALAIAGDRVVVTSDNRYSVLDLSSLRQNPNEEIPKLLTRAELTTNQKLQLGELVPILQEEWTSRWEHWVATRQTPEEMARSLANKLDEAQSESARLAIAKRAIRFNLTERLQQLRPNDPHLQIALAVELSRDSHKTDLQRILRKAMGDGLEALRKSPTDDSLQRSLTYLAPLVTDQLLTEAETATRWAILKPAEMMSEGGATLTLLEDGSILVSGPHIAGDTYTLNIDNIVDVVTTIRLEVLPDESLPSNGPGRHESGNFHLTAFQLFGPSSGNAGRLPIDITRVTATFAYLSTVSDVAGTINENLDTAWHVWGRTGEKHHATFELATPLRAESGNPLTIVIKHRDALGGLNLGRFRIWVSDDSNAFEQEIQRLAVLKLTDPWEKLAVVYHLLGDQPELDKLLEHHPRAAAGIAVLHLTTANWQRAIELYNKLITDQTADATLLSKRAAAYIATEQWDLARADWSRAVQLEPELLENAFDDFRQAEQWSMAAEFGLPILKQKPEDSYRWLRVAPVIVLSDDQSAYIAFCNWIVQQPTEDIVSAERAIKVCLLRADGIDLTALPTEALTGPLDKGHGTRGFQPWGWSTRALLAYRSGDAESATKYITKSEELHPVELNHAMNLSVLALAQHQLNHPEEARKALDDARQFISQLQAEKIYEAVPALSIAEILFRETEAKINDQQSPNAVGESESVPSKDD